MQGLIFLMELQQPERDAKNAGGEKKQKIVGAEQVVPRKNG